MRKQIRGIIFVSLMAVILTGCNAEKSTTTDVRTSGTDLNVTAELTSTPTPTITPTPTATPVPTLSPLEIKYQYYDSNYVDPQYNYTIEKDIEKIEKILSDSKYYNTWYGYSESSYEQSFEINENTRDGRGYGIKCISYPEDTYNVYYYYTDDPNVVFRDAIYPYANDGDVYVLSPYEETGAFSNLPTSEFEEYVNTSMGEVEENYVEETKHIYTLEEIYPHAKQTAEDKVMDMVDYNMWAGFMYYDDSIYFEYDGNYTYYLYFDIRYHLFSEGTTFRAECTYVQQDDGSLALKDIDLEYK